MLKNEQEIPLCPILPTCPKTSEILTITAWKLWSVRIKYWFYIFCNYLISWAVIWYYGRILNNRRLFPN